MRTTDTWLAEEFAVADAAAGTFAGVAAVYNRDVHRGYGLYLRLLPGAFAGQLADPARVKVLWQHDHQQPIGHVTELTDTPTRLRFAARISDATQQAREAMALLRDKVLDEVSVGFDLVTWDEVKGKDDAGNQTYTYVVAKARLTELSVVTWGALGRDARATVVHSHPRTQQPCTNLRAAHARRERARLLRHTMR